MSNNRSQDIILLENIAKILLEMAKRQDKIEKTQDIISKILFDTHLQAKQSREVVQSLFSSKSYPNGPRVRAVFLVHSIETWDALFDIYSAMQKSEKFSPVVATINRRFGGDNYFSGEERVSQELTNLGVAHIRLNMDDSFSGLSILRRLDPDIIFRQSQWDSLYPPAFSSDYLGFSKICVVPYGTSIVAKFMNGEQDKGYSDLSFDTPYHQVAWRVFCETKKTYDYIKSFQHAPNEKLVLSGYPKLDYLIRAEPEWPIVRTIGGGRRPYRIIWAPHHTAQDEWLNFGVFHRIYKEFLEFARKRQDVDFVLKPHPELFSSVVNRKVLSQEEVNGFLADWISLPNCSYEMSRYGGLFAASDLMVTDGISFIIEYPIFNKPLVFFDSGLRSPLNAIGQMGLACADSVFDFFDMCKTIESYIEGKPVAYKKEREDLIKLLFPCKERASEIILNNILLGLGVE